MTKFEQIVLPKIPLNILITYLAALPNRPKRLRYHKVTSSNTSRLEAHAGFFRLLSTLLTKSWFPNRSGHVIYNERADSALTW